MSYLYASLGILMFSGITLISKHTLLFSEKNYYSNYYNSEYISSNAQQVDKYILRIMEIKKTSLGFNNEICYNLKSAIINSGLFDNQKVTYKVFPKTNSKHPNLINSCVLTNGSHRILISRKFNNFNKFSLNSCLLTKNQYCTFEKN